MSNSGTTVYPSQLDNYANPGTATLEDASGYSHAALHSQVHEAIEAIESTLGTTAGTSVLKDFTAGQFPVRMDAGGTLKVTLTGGTISSPLISGTVTGTTVFSAFPQVGGTPSGTADLVNKNYVDTNGAASYTSLNDQALINGNFDVWQRATTFTQVDDRYIADRWVALQEANSSWNFSRSTDVPDLDSTYSLLGTCITANNQCAVVQIIESVDAIKLAGATVSLSFWAKTSAATISNLRATVLAWNSTADAVTSDVISAWASDGTDPTWATNWTAEVAGANKTLTTSWQKFTITGIALDTASTSNLAVVIWVDDGTIATGDAFYITQVKLNRGASVTAFNPISFDEELRKCRRYFEADASYGGALKTGYHTYIVPPRVNGHLTFNFTERKRIEPGTAQLGLYYGTTPNVLYNVQTGGSVSFSPTSFSATDHGLIVLYDSSNPFTANEGYGLNWECDVEL